MIPNIDSITSAALSQFLECVDRPLREVTATFRKAIEFSGEIHID
jgi:hypothetical protein